MSGSAVKTSARKCDKCPNPAAAGRTSCPGCLAKKRAYQAAKFARGECAGCSQPVVPGHRSCERHLARMRAYTRSWKNRRGRSAVVAADAADAADAERAPTPEAVAVQLDALTDEQRLAMFARYCQGCGRKDPGCRCWDDE